MKRVVAGEQFIASVPHNLISESESLSADLK